MHCQWNSQPYNLKAQSWYKMCHYQGTLIARNALAQSLPGFQLLFICNSKHRVHFIIFCWGEGIAICAFMLGEKEKFTHSLKHNASVVAWKINCQRRCLCLMGFGAISLEIGHLAFWLLSPSPTAAQPSLTKGHRGHCESLRWGATTLWPLSSE